ncbi:aspartyl protease [bacterium]|nr:aspartyl protease [bacterium]
MKMQLPIMGWRERVSLPDIHLKSLIAKVDTGAKTCSLHAEDISIVRVGRRKFVKFTVFPSAKDLKKTIRVRAELVDYRWVKDTGGKKTYRPVISSIINLGAYSWDVEITLVDRAPMKHRFLLARDAVKGHFLIDVSHSFLLSKSRRLSKKK